MVTCEGKRIPKSQHTISEYATAVLQTFPNRLVFTMMTSLEETAAINAMAWYGNPRAMNRDPTMWTKLSPEANGVDPTVSEFWGQPVKDSPVIPPRILPLSCAISAIARHGK
jgi:hypothetical protein